VESSGTSLTNSGRRNIRPPRWLKPLNRVMLLLRRADGTGDLHLLTFCWLWVAPFGELAQPRLVAEFGQRTEEYSEISCRTGR
jgi:hypothetical protein